MKSYDERHQDWANAVTRLLNTKPLTAEALTAFVCAVMQVTRQGSGLSSRDLEAAIDEAFRKRDYA